MDIFINIFIRVGAIIIFIFFIVLTLKLLKDNEK